MGPSGVQNVFFRHLQGVQEGQQREGGHHLAGVRPEQLVRVSRSYIFTGTNQWAKFYEIDHDTKQVYIEEMGIEPDADSLKFSTQEQVCVHLHHEQEYHCPH